MPPRVLAFGLAACVFLLDRATKLLIQSRVPPWETLRVIPGFFNIIHTENPGAAFSLLSGVHTEWRGMLLVGISSVALVLIAALLWRPGGRIGDSWLLRLGLALILGGAFGNVYDRIAHGTVTDFLDLYVNGFHWPAFNVADSTITVGAALVLLDLARSRCVVKKSDASSTVSNR